MLHHLCILGDPQHRGTKSEVAASPLPSWGPKRGRKCYIIPEFSGSTTEGEGNKSGPRQDPGKNPIVGSLMAVLNKKKIGPKGPPCLTRPVEKRPSERGTRSEVANKWPESSKA